MAETSNLLSNESSPYLLQHANNPVHWMPYGVQALEVAEKLNRPLIISIGYSACHWCHVMERESFENVEIANYMNQHFICIKIDREERPDLDHFYMDAIRQLGGHGGWPLNCFALPDGRPFWGGTYFAPYNWLKILEQVHQLYATRKSDLIVQANSQVDQLQKQYINLVTDSSHTNSKVDWNKVFNSIKSTVDTQFGGQKGYPKFPLPVFNQLLLDLYVTRHEQLAFSMVKTTLNAMARGGIFDQIGGGFARYSTDEIWKVPHFEKMLYDNAQLTSLYCKAWLLTGEKLFADVVKLCIEFVFNELTSNTGVFYTALDADSDGEEGRYYTWKTADFNRILGHYSKLVGEFYGIENQGLWEADKNILLQTSPKAIFAQQHFLSENELEALLEYSRKLLLSERRKNNPPLLDNKVLLNINSMMIKALVEAFLTFDTKTYLQSAIKAAQFILDNFTRNEQEYIHCFGLKPATVAAFLDDYAEFGGALLLLYTATGSLSWLIKAQEIAEYMYAHFYNADTGFFGYTSNSEQQGFARKIDVYDGVTPSANSATAMFLYKLGWLINNVLYKERGNLMAVEMKKYLMFQPSAYSNWGRLNLMIETEMIVVAAVGSNSAAVVSALWKIFPDHPNVLLCSSLQGDNLPYTSHRYMDGKTNIYICKGNTCELPLTNISEAKELILRLLEDKKINH